MDKPIITINGKIIEMKTPKARAWREIMKFNEDRQSLPASDFCEEHAKMIALAFGVSADEVLDNLDVDDILPTYLNVFTSLVGLLTAKLAIDKKNAAGEVEAQT